jgi:hypothetical protein
MTVKSKGITKFVRVKESDAQLLPAPDALIEKLVKRSPSAQPDPLKTCVIGLLNQGGRDEEEATAWCKDYLAMKTLPDIDEPTAVDSANVREAERIMVDAKESLKPYFMERCVRTRQGLFGEPEFEATKKCRQDWILNERTFGTMVATDAESRVRQLTEVPESFHKLEVLRLQLDSRTSELVNHCSLEEADRRARKELGLPRVYPKRKPDVATVPDVTGKSQTQIINEIQAVNADKRPGERMISPCSGVPNLYGKSRGQAVKEVFEQDAEDRNR